MTLPIKHMVIFNKMFTRDTHANLFDTAGYDMVNDSNLSYHQEFKTFGSVNPNINMAISNVEFFERLDSNSGFVITHKLNYMLYTPQAKYIIIFHHSQSKDTVIRFFGDDGTAFDPAVMSYKHCYDQYKLIHKMYSHPMMCLAAEFFERYEPNGGFLLTHRFDYVLADNEKA